MDPLRELLEAAATNLSGHNCRVRWRRPALKGARADCFKNNGQAFIDLDPSETWDQDRLLYTIAHESGHVRDLFEEWAGGILDLPSGSILVTKEARALPGVVAIEDTADRLARQWIAYAKANYMRYWEPDDLGTIAAYLRCLADWKE